VSEFGSVPWLRAVASGLSLLVLVVVGMVLDWDVTWVVAASSLAEALNSAIRARSIAKWEDKHGVEFLRANDTPRTGRRYRQYLAGSGPTHLYVRPRPAANGDATGRTEP
ncbi:MAG: hypothetical protein M3137_10990, partial [Actinomycetota bacterium]|nr:hypothetical protein [Actinomycetota bacterium]